MCTLVVIVVARRFFHWQGRTYVRVKRGVKVDIMWLPRADREEEGSQAGTTQGQKCDCFCSFFSFTGSCFLVCYRRGMDAGRCLQADG